MAQRGTYDRALAEIKSGHKRTHWMWFIFPQVKGLGSSYVSDFYGITSLDEARAYLEHPVLGPRLLEITETCLTLDGGSAHEIFGYPDDLKMCSSMTMFAQVSPPNSVFHRTVEKYFDGEFDGRTMELLELQ